MIAAATAAIQRVTIRADKVWLKAMALLGGCVGFFVAYIIEIRQFRPGAPVVTGGGVVLNEPPGPVPPLPYSGVGKGDGLGDPTAGFKRVCCAIVSVSRLEAIPSFSSPDSPRSCLSIGPPFAVQGILFSGCGPTAHRFVALGESSAEATPAARPSVSQIPGVDEFRGTS